MKLPQILFSLLKELILWLFLPVFFIIYYVYFWSNSVKSAAVHIYLILQITLFVFALHGLIRLVVPNKKVSALVVSFIYTACLFLLLFYYILIYIGLQTWGRVITEELIVNYSHQIKALCDALGLSYLLIQAVILTVFIICWILLYFYIFKDKLIDYFLYILQPIASCWIQISLITTLTILAFYPLAEYPNNTLKYIKFKEPISLTLWAGKPLTAKHSATQGNRLNNALDQQELAILSNYRRSSATKKSNIILIIVDALRPSNMSIYGYAQNTTPNLNQRKKQPK